MSRARSSLVPKARGYSAAVSLRDVHADWAWVVVIANAVAGCWALAAHWLAPLRVRYLWWLVVAAEVAVVPQVLMGVWMLSVDDIHAPQFHVFYGFVTLISVVILFAYRSQLRAQLFLLYGVGGLFLMGLGLRAIYLG